MYMEDIEIQHIRAKVNEMKKSGFSMSLFMEYMLELSVYYKYQENVQPVNIVLTAPPGTGKTFSITEVSSILGLKLHRIDFYNFVYLVKNIELKGKTELNCQEILTKIFPQDDPQAFEEGGIFVIEDLDCSLLEDEWEVYLKLKTILDIHNREAAGYNKSILLLTGFQLNSFPKELLAEARKFEYGCLGLEEKKYIAKSFWRKAKGISKGILNGTVEITEPALEYLINHYTQEAGVNELKEVLKELGQKMLFCKAAGLEFKNSLDKEEIRKLIGNGRYYFDDEISNNIPYGIGLAWTSKGGTLLPFELTVTPGNGRLSITGNVGKTMMESIQVVVQYMRYDSDRLGIEKTYFDTHNLAVNIPEIALSKDGASAALAVFVLIYACIKGKKLNRPAAVTGELSLTGKAIRVGGLKEKFNVAGCHHIKTVFLPKQSMDEYLRLPDCIKNQVEAIFVNDAMELIKRLEEDFFENNSQV